MRTTSDEHGRRLLDRVLAGARAEDTAEAEGPLRHVADLPPRPARHADWPDWAPAELVDALNARGTARPWTHQRAGADTARAGQHVVIATGTASGKSLAYQLPILSALHDDEAATALYLAPTKALAADQLRGARELDLPGTRPAAYDGDTPRGERDWARAHGRWIFTNPDMLHHGVLPGHQRWARFLRNLRYVVIDECHGYRGVFGSHVALLLRRLRRVARHYGAEPVFVLASATVARPEEMAARLTGVDCTAITEDGSPRGQRTVAFWEPPLLPDVTGENGAPVRRGSGTEAARLMTDLVVEDARTLAFVRSRRGVETAALTARRALGEVAPELPERVASYRGGYLPEERRALERALVSGELRAVATTNALELGVDIAGLDAVLIAGYPGTLASFWQQAGRAGREGAGALVVFIARDEPLDTYLVGNPGAILDRPVETTVLDPTNPYVLEPHVVCAAAELPLGREDLAVLGGEAAESAVSALTADGVLRARPRGWFWTSRKRPHGDVELRGTGGQPVAVVEADTGRMLGTVDPGSACSTVHEGAVYLHRGESFVVDELDLDEGIALVHAENPEWTTSPRETTDISVLRTVDSRVPRRDARAGASAGEGARSAAAPEGSAGGGGAAADGVTEEGAAGEGAVAVSLGEVDVTSQVVGYLRKLPSGEVLDQVALDLPEQTLRTRAVWYSVPQELLMSSAPGGAGLEPARLPGALHAAEHAAIGLLPLFATCDRWDIGGVSTAVHPDTGEATVFVHDGHPGGAGFADRAYAAIVPWLAATREAIASCECPAGCPSCVQSPKCGNGNEPLDKAGAVAVLDTVLAAWGEPVASGG
ncbi:DEAD/DEAH box helicase [Salinifilum ghardaiensis]